MTKKNATKQAARTRLQRFGGKFLHHRRIVSGPAAGPVEPADTRLTVSGVVVIARETAPSALIGTQDAFGDAPIVLVVVDAADPLGGLVAVMSNVQTEGVSVQEARSAVEVEVKQRTARGESSPFMGVMKVDDLVKVLGRALPPAQIDISVRIIAQLSALPPAGHAHVLAVAEGTMIATTASVVELCWCGHPRREHAETGACTWVGVPDGRPIIGLSLEMLAQARALGIPMRCPCASPITHYYDKLGRRLPAK
ncbi:MAG: hypothetical protein U0359_14180 [Byssovorax sp.]